MLPRMAKHSSTHGGRIARAPNTMPKQPTPARHDHSDYNSVVRCCDFKSLTRPYYAQTKCTAIVRNPPEPGGWAVSPWLGARRPGRTSPLSVSTVGGPPRGQQLEAGCTCAVVPCRDAPWKRGAQTPQHAQVAVADVGGWEGGIAVETFGGDISSLSPTTGTTSRFFSPKTGTPSRRRFDPTGALPSRQAPHPRCSFRRIRSSRS